MQELRMLKQKNFSICSIAGVTLDAFKRMAKKLFEKCFWAPKQKKPGLKI